MINSLLGCPGSRLRVTSHLLRSFSSSSKTPYQHPTKINFYYDTLCPNSWLAFEILLRYRPVWALDLTLCPVSLKMIQEANKAPSILTQLRNSFNYSQYYFHDVERRGKIFKVPIQIPESPYYLFGAAGSDNQQQFLLALRSKYPELLEEASRQLWYRTWSEDMDVNKIHSLLVMAERIGLNVDEAIELIESIDSHKEALKTESQNAVEAGVFGLPFIQVIPNGDKSESFHGADSFEVLASLLKKTWNGPIPNPENFKPIQDAPVSDVFVSLEVFDKIQEEAAKVERNQASDKKS
ncbi:glutathione S-transferase kappa 1 [Lepeophtheirus salmonis]|uniref:Glutathione S-transferase kappa 1 n=1 Tax=Lepeophtheirus salmonis TaxID=72036 RepID=C1BS06_LEPSM|nr:glutathione S-transferase kappa 1-like [Lepeophtheirus salmonis]ACO11809.1 Glutathione S-transferase kappa 1 [Lepeophtheirus salmonis]